LETRVNPFYDLKGIIYSPRNFSFFFGFGITIPAEVVDIMALELPPSFNDFDEARFQKDQRTSQLGFSQDGVS
jgi:hypothetical protein